ncbi:hypothetical protein [Pseudoalteromonas lipolytica]|uniref:hypothetical protein n=1 Tax=Pseudoalteromonas lipolytica TaxID=570156 RepID=UPI003A97A9D2
MPYFVIALVSITLLLCQPAKASQPKHAVLMPPTWLNTSPHLSPLATTQHLTFDAKQHRYLWLPEGHWLEIAPALLNQFILSAGNTQYLQQRLRVHSDLLCNTKRCQLPATGHNRIIAIQNHLDERAEFTAMIGHYQGARDSFRRAIKIAAPSIQLSSAQGNERYYALKKNEEVKLFFPAAKKLTISVRQNMQQPDPNGVVYASIDNELVARVNTINSQAFEFSEYDVGLVNSDYLAIAAGQYLTLKSHTNAYIKIEQSHRAIYDDRAAEKEQEKLLLPYWLTTANEAIESVYNTHSFSVFSDGVYTQNNPLSIKRHYNLLSMMTVQSKLTGSTEHSSLQMHSKTISELVEQRLVDERFYPRINQQVRELTYLGHQPIEFDLSIQQRATPWLTLIAKTQQDTQFQLTAGERNWLINLKATEHYQTLMISVPISTSSVTIKRLTNTSKPIDFALYARTLASLPSDELLYQQQGDLTETSPIIANLLSRYLNKQHDDYVASIEPYTPALQNNPDIDWQASLTKAQHIATSAPLEALALLKPLSTSPDPDIAIQAWQLRVAILREQHQFHLANSYLEGLYKSAQHAQLKHYAAQALVRAYQAEQIEHKLFALCAGNVRTIEQCEAQLINLAVKQQKNRLAVWLAHHTQAQTQVEHSFSALNYQSLTELEKPEEALYQRSIGSQYAFINPEGKQQSTLVNNDIPWVFTANRAMHLSIKARTKADQSGEYHTAWLKADSQYQHKLMPIFSDIAATSQFVSNQQAVSIAANLVISLQAGETLTVTTNQAAYLDISVIPKPLFALFDYYSDATTQATSDDISSLIHAHDTTPNKLLINGLYLLSEKRLSNNQYTQLLQRIDTFPPSAHSVFLQNRIERFGQWQPIENMLDYAGTRLFNMQETEQRSFADRFAQHTTQSAPEQGILLRPFHTLYVDLTKTEGTQIRFKFNFSSAELARANRANISFQLANQQKVWSVSEQQSIPFTFNKRELNNNTIAVRWLNPYLSQQLAIEAEQYIAGQWRALPLPTNLAFYTVSADTPLIANLPADTLVKLEEMNENKRSERRFFHPAGKIEVRTDQLKYVRLYRWHLSERNNKITSFSDIDTPLPELITYQAPSAPKIVNKQATLHSDETNLQGFIRYDRQHIFQSAEDIPAQQETDIGVRLRFNDQQHWYQFEGYYAFDEKQHDFIALNGYHSWLDDTSHWFIDSQITSRWQLSRDNSDSQYALNGAISIGQVWRQDTVHRHQWSVAPFIHISSADLNDYLNDEKLNSNIFNFYRENHASGWQGSYQYRYQPWVDNYLNFGVASGSNDDWLSLDYLRFNSSWNQYYHGHILQVGLDSYYRFADDHRATATWQYISRVAWQKQIDIGSFSQGWLKISWQQDWGWNNHNISLEFSSGNNQHTGFAPYAHDEIIFPTLQLNHLLERRDYEQ